MLATLRRRGLLLESDPRLPSVVSVIAGRPIPGSWWGHPLGGLIYRESNWLGDRPDVILLKLLNRKVTYVFRTLWPQVYAIGSSNGSWQRRSLSVAGQRLLNVVRRHGLIRTDDPRARLAAGPRLPAVALDVERRLLVLGLQVHTETGRHAKTLESWTHWAGRIGLQERMPVAAAKADLEERVRRLNDEFQGAARLPWQS